MSNLSPLEVVRRPWSTRLLLAGLITAAVGIVLWLFLDVLLVASVWPPVEVPPLQGEAVLPSSADTNRPVHAPSALASPVRERENAWSCIGFVLVAALLVTGARDALTRWFALAVASAGICAMLYHASAARDLRHADIFGLYWTMALLVVIAAIRMGTLPAATGRGWKAFLIWFGLGVLAAFATAFRSSPIAGFTPFSVPVVSLIGALLLASMLLVYCLRQADPRKWRLGLGAIAAIGIGFRAASRRSSGRSLEHARWFPATARGVACVVCIGPGLRDGMLRQPHPPGRGPRPDSGRGPPVGDRSDSCPGSNTSAGIHGLVASRAASLSAPVQGRVPSRSRSTPRWALGNVPRRVTPVRLQPRWTRMRHDATHSHRAFHAGLIPQLQTTPCFASPFLLSFFSSRRRFLPPLSPRTWLGT